MFLSYDKSETGHPANKDVALRIMSLHDDMAENKVRTLVRIVGGSGSSNVPSWAPDSRRFAFVSYQLFADDEAPSK
jgi:Tol biopolymer transport system component